MKTDEYTASLVQQLKAELAIVRAELEMAHRECIRLHNEKVPIETALFDVRQELSVVRAELDKAQRERDELKQQVACGGPLNTERWTLDELLDELIKAKAVASGRTCVSFENLCWGSSSLWHQTHRENFRKIDRKPEELSRFVLNEFGGVQDDFAKQVLEILQRQKQELATAHADNERHRKLNLDYENQLIECRRELATSEASRKEFVEVLKDLAKAKGSNDNGNSRNHKE